MAATQEWVNSHVFPIEQAVTNLTQQLEETRIQLATRDADLQAAERRFEEIAKQMERLEQDRQSEGTDTQGERTGSSQSQLMKKPAL